MKYVNGDFVSENNDQIKTFDRTGNEIAQEKKNFIPAYAKIVTNTCDGKSVHYILTHQSTPMDPMGPYGRRERALDTKMKKVSKGTFDFYVTYLKTNNSIYLTKAQRGFLND